MSDRRVTIRLAVPKDAPTLRRLAQRLRRYRLLRQDGDDAPARGRQRHLV